MDWTINKMKIYCDKQQGDKKEKTINKKLFFVIQRNCWCFDMNILGHCDPPQQCIHSLCFLMVFWSCLKWMIIRMKQILNRTYVSGTIRIILLSCYLLMIAQLSHSIFQLWSLGCKPIRLVSRHVLSAQNGWCEFYD